MNLIISVHSYRYRAKVKAIEMISGKGSFQGMCRSMQHVWFPGQSTRGRSVGYVEAKAFPRIQT